MSTRQVIDLLGGSRVIGEVRSPIEMAQAVRHGLPWAAFEALVTALAISQAELGAVLHIRARTLSRRKDSGRLEAMESDRLFPLARVFAHAVEVFESAEWARLARVREPCPRRPQAVRAPRHRRWRPRGG